MELEKDSTRTKEARSTKFLALLIVLLALVLRLYHLGRESLWIDEGFSLRDILGLDLAHETRPFYFTLMSGWMRLVGYRSEFFLRLPSVLFGVASVWMLYLIGRRLMGSRTALLASAFMAISVLNINHSREIRMYSLAVLTTLTATYFLLLWLERGRPIDILGYGIAAVASLLTYPLTILVLAAHGLYLLLYVNAYKPRALALVCTQIVTVAAWTPWLLGNMQTASDFSVGYTSIIERPTLVNVISLLGKFFLWKWSDPGKALKIIALVFSLILLVLALRGLREFRRTNSGLTFVLLWLVVPMTGMIILSYTVSNMWMPHYMIAVSPAFFLLVANGIGSIRNRSAAVALVLLVGITVSGRLYLYYSKHSRPEWRTAVSHVQEYERPGDIIGIYYGGNEYVFNYYYRGRSRWSAVGEGKITKEHFVGWNDEKVGRMIDSFPLSGKRFWLLLSNHEYAGGPVITKYVDTHYRVLEHLYYSQIELILFDADGERVPRDLRASNGIVQASRD